jgi:prepilin-type N-terminal cleavage/methylation domain-containing protein
MYWSAKKNLSCYKNGFTIIELLISITIFSFIIIAIYAVFDLGNLSWNQQQVAVELQQNVRAAIDGITREIRHSDYSEIMITDIDSDGNNEIQFSHPGSNDEIYYYLQGNQIIREHPPGNNAKVIANYITDLGCSLSGGLITIYIKGQKQDNSQRVANFALEEKIASRN